MTTLDLPIARSRVGGLPAPVRHSLSLAWRTLLRIRRTPEQLLDVTLQPPIFIVLFVYVFGGAISGTQHDYLQYVLPSLMVQTVIFGTIAIGANLNDDIKNGVFDRFRSLPADAGFRPVPVLGVHLPRHAGARVRRGAGPRFAVPVSAHVRVDDVREGRDDAGVAAGLGARQPDHPPQRGRAQPDGPRKRRPRPPRARTSK